MKTFRFIGMAILMAVVCGTFFACSGDDEDSADSQGATPLIGQWEEYGAVDSRPYGKMYFELDGTYRFYGGGSVAVEKGRYKVNMKKNIITLYDRSGSTDHDDSDQERGFFMSDNDHLRFQARKDGRYYDFRRH